MEDFSFVIEIVQSVGLWAIFAYLYINEKQAHQETRKEYREDLREIAGIRQSLTRPTVDTPALRPRETSSTEAP